MSCNYADGLSPYHDKGQLGLEEKFDSKSVVLTKVSLLSKWINEAKHVVIHTGAGISTSAGIPDFRGPRGVWTLQAKGEKPDLSKDFNEAIPTITHMAIMKLVEKQKIKYVVSQNIDGLHLRSNLQRKYLSELHGNMFTEQCSSCNRQFVRSSPVPTVGQKSLNKPCPATKTNGRPCRGRLHDTILDWEHNLPENDLGMADYHSCMADLSISLGTTMQIVPSGNLPLYTKRHGGKLVIVNLQPTKHDRKANLLIHAYVDEVMTLLMKNLNIKIPKYSAKNDPTRTLSLLNEKFLEWTISDSTLKKMKKIYEEKCGSKEARKRLEMIYDDVPVNINKNLKRKGREEEDSDLEVLDVIVKPKRSRHSSKKEPKKTEPPMYNTTITIKKVIPPPKKPKYEGEKITIKKNVTPTKTKYEIVTKPKKIQKCEIVYNTDSDLCNDLDMICESDDDENTNNFTYNFKLYLQDNKKTFKVEEGSLKSEIKNEIEIEETKKEKEEFVDKIIEKESEEEKAPDKQIKINDPITILGENGVKEETVNISIAFEKSSYEIGADLDAKHREGNPLKESISNEIPTMEDVTEEKLCTDKPTIGELVNKPENLPLNENYPLNIESKQSIKPSSEAVKSLDNKEMKKIITGMDNSDKQENMKSETDTYPNLEAELKGLSNSNLKGEIEEIVNQSDTTQFGNSLEVPTSTDNSAVDFYNNEFNSSNNTTDLDYASSTYYNNF